MQTTLLFASAHKGCGLLYTLLSLAVCGISDTGKGVISKQQHTREPTRELEGNDMDGEERACMSEA